MARILGGVIQRVGEAQQFQATVIQKSHRCHRSWKGLLRNEWARESCNPSCNHGTSKRLTIRRKRLAITNIFDSRDEGESATKPDWPGSIQVCDMLGMQARVQQAGYTDLP